MQIVDDLAFAKCSWMHFVLAMPVNLGVLLNSHENCIKNLVLRLIVLFMNSADYTRHGHLNL